MNLAVPDTAWSTIGGLGLAIVRAHVEAHGGSVRAENHDSGARFIIELPRQPGPAGGDEGC